MGFSYNDDYSYDPRTGAAALTKTWSDGTVDKYTGLDALANHDSPERNLYRRLEPGDSFSRLRRHNDYRNSLAYKAGAGLRNYANSKDRNMFSRLMGDNALQAGAVLGGTGVLAGLLGNAVLRGLGLADNPKLQWVGGIGGAIAGGLIGNARSNALEYDARNALMNSMGMTKMSAMYKDPRNFVLEKLMSARDLSASEKAQLAAQVRRMDRPRAEKLSGLVRSALGFGVGAVIAKFFGLNTRGTVLGGLVGVLGSGIMRALRKPGGFGF